VPSLQVRGAGAEVGATIGLYGFLAALTASTTWESTADVQTPSILSQSPLLMKSLARFVAVVGSSP